MDRQFQISDVAALRRLDTMIWLVITVVATIVFLSPVVSDFRIAWSSFVSASAASIILMALSWYYDARRNEARLSSALGCTAQIAMFSAVGAPLSYLAASAGFPAKDAAFDAFDKALGFDWMSVFAW